MGIEQIELPPGLNLLSKNIIGAAIDVHRALGAGLPEKLYEAAFLHELVLRGLHVEQQVPIALQYKGMDLLGLRLDLVVERMVIVELKSVEKVLDVHLAQLLGYMRAGGFPPGLLINFNVTVLIQGLHRRINSAALKSHYLLSSSATSA
jgi:GxxExxY protein